MTGQSHRLLASKVLGGMLSGPVDFLVFSAFILSATKDFETQASVSREVSVSPLSAQVIPCPQLVGGVKCWIVSDQS